VSAAVLESSTHVGGAVAVAAYAAVLSTGGDRSAYLVAALLGVAGAVAVTRWQGRPESSAPDQSAVATGAGSPGAPAPAGARGSRAR
jgi:hypothetical protein